MCQVDKSFRDVCNDDEFWRLKLKKKYPTMMANIEKYHMQWLNEFPTSTWEYKKVDLYKKIYGILIHPTNRMYWFL